jgi:CelD/BcsL family acetyltransferase involved in cellulose biosynthesis
MAGAAATACDVSDPQWLAFVRSHPAATTFHHPQWLELLAAVYGYRPLVLTLRDADNSIVAGTPLLEVRSWLTGRRFISLPFTDYCPPLARDPASLAGLASALTRWWRDAGEPRVEIRGAVPASYGFHPVQVGVRHVLALEPDVLQVRARFRKSSSRMIRQAQREGVEVAQIRSPDGLDPFYRLHCMTRRRLGVPVQPRRFFVALWRSIIEREMGFLLLAHRAGRPIAGMLFLSWNRNLIYKYSASDPAHVQFRPNNLLLGAAIEWGCQNGYRTLDFGKTEITQHGLRAFKSGWGAAELPLEYSYAGAEPRQQQTGFVSRVSSKIIQLSPPIVCRAIGEALYGHFA